MLYDFDLWRDDAQLLLLNYLKTSARRLREAALGLNQDKHFFHLLERYEEALNGDDGDYTRSYVPELRIKFTIPRTDDTSWSNEVEVRIAVEDNFEWRSELRKAKKERRGPRGQKFRAEVECRAHVGGSKPTDAVRIARMLTELSALTVELEGDLEVVLRRIGNYPEDEAKQKAQEEMFERRRFLGDAIEDAVRDDGVKHHVWYRRKEKMRSFVDEIVSKYLTITNDDGTQELAEFAQHRFDAKTRKLLNKVPSKIFAVSHTRGGPSTITPTKKARACIEQLWKDQAEREAKEAKKAA
jgi:hypothetical protein